MTVRGLQRDPVPLFSQIADLQRVQKELPEVLPVELRPSDWETRVSAGAQGTQTSGSAQVLRVDAAHPVAVPPPSAQTAESAQQAPAATAETRKRSAATPDRDRGREREGARDRDGGSASRASLVTPYRSEPSALKRLSLQEKRNHKEAIQNSFAKDQEELLREAIRKYPFAYCIFTLYSHVSQKGEG